MLQHTIRHHNKQNIDLPYLFPSQARPERSVLYTETMKSAPTRPPGHLDSLSVFAQHKMSK